MRQRQRAVADDPQGHATAIANTADPASGIPALARMVRRLPPVLLLGLAMSGFQAGSALAIKAYPVAGPVGTSFDRLTTAAIALWLIFRPRVGRWTRADFVQSVSFGVLIACILLSSSEANSRMALGAVVTIASLGPLAVSAITRRRRWDIAWGAVALGGVVLIARPAGRVNFPGLGFAAAWAVAWALYILVGNRLNQGFATTEWLPVAMAIAAVICGALAFTQRPGGMLHPTALLFAVIAGIVGNVLTYMLELEALRRLATNLFSICMSFEPAFAAIWGFVLLGQSVRLWELIGVACVVMAAIGTSWPGRTPT